MVEIGTSRMYSGDSVSLSFACKEYLIKQNFLPHIHLPNCIEETYPLKRKAKLRRKPPTPFLMLGQQRGEVPGFIVCIRDSRKKLTEAEQKYLDDFNEQGFFIVLSYSYESFVDLVNWIKNESNAKFPKV